MARKQSKATDIVKQIAAVEVDTALQAMVSDDQREITLILSPLDAMAYPENLFGAMQKALGEGRGAVARVSDEWREWIKQQQQVTDMMKRALIVIEFYSSRFMNDEENDTE